MGLRQGHGETLQDGAPTNLEHAARVEEDKEIILGHFLGLMGNDGGVDELCRFMLHCGINGNDIARAGGSWGLAVLRHYLTLDGYDMEKAGSDLATFPPVAARIGELKGEDEHRKEVEAWDRRERRKRASVRSTNSADIPN